MNVIGKIFVFAVFVMSLVFMSFAVAIYSSHVNWEQEVNRKPEEVRGAQQPGLKYQKEQWENERKKLESEIGVLARKVAESEASRDQMIAKLQSALELKSGELVELRKSKEEREQTQREAIEKLEAAQANLKKAADEVDTLRKQVQAQQVAVDGKVSDATKLAGELNAALAELAIATERKADREKQLARARELLGQSGLNPQSDPSSAAVADGEVVAVSTRRCSCFRSWRSRSAACCWPSTCSLAACRCGPDRGGRILRCSSHGFGAAAGRPGRFLRSKKGQPGQGQPGHRGTLAPGSTDFGPACGETR